MMTMFRNGGFPMYFILAFGVIGLLTAFVFAINPQRGREGFIRQMGNATLFSIFSGTCADLAAVANYISSQKNMDGRAMAAVVIEGVGESMSPGILGFSLLSLIALMTAVGSRRLAARQVA